MKKLKGLPLASKRPLACPTWPPSASWTPFARQVGPSSRQVCLFARQVGLQGGLSSPNLASECPPSVRQSDFWWPCNPQNGALAYTRAQFSCFCNVGSQQGLLAQLGVSWAPLGLNLGSLGRLLGSTWALLGASWAQLGRSWALLGLNLGVLGGFWTSLGLTWPPSGLQMAIPGRFWALRGSILGPPRVLRWSILVPCQRTRPTTSTDSRDSLTRLPHSSDCIGCLCLPCCLRFLCAFADRFACAAYCLDYLYSLCWFCWLHCLRCLCCLYCLRCLCCLY